MPVTFATFNVRNLFLADDPRGEGRGALGSAKRRAFVDERLEHLAAQIARIDADVVLLQEVTGEASLEALAARVAARVPYATRFAAPTDERGIGNALLSRLPVRWVRSHGSAALPVPVFVEGQAPPFGAALPLRRPFVHALVEARELGAVHVFGAHLKSQMPRALRRPDGSEVPPATAAEHAEGLFRTLLMRSAEALLLRQRVDEAIDGVPEAERKAIVLGDLNDTVDSFPVRLLRSRGPAALHPAIEFLTSGRRRTVIHGGDGLVIDHALMTWPLFRLVRSVVIHDDGLKELGRSESTAIASDHAPVLVEVG
jgi:endonuclease/exonuclease/phosphatase family metal-dependent hydrolase